MKGISEAEYQGLVLSVGTHRSARPLSPLEVAELLNKAIAAGATRAQCAEELGIGSSQVSAFLSLLLLVPQIRHLADWQGSKAASVAFSTMAELRRLKHDDQTVAANAALAHKLTWKEAVQLVQIAIRSGKPIEECISRVLDLRPRITTRHLFVGAITSPETRAYLSALPQRNRDALLSKALQKLTESNYPVGARLGRNEFTILSDHNLHDLLGLQPDEIEQFINQTLAKGQE